jgi:hypothetical protein
MASKIRELKDTIVSQNNLIAALQRDKGEVTDGLRSLYTALVKYKVAYTTEAVDAETASYPDIRSEDLTALSKTELVVRIGGVFAAVTNSLGELRTEVKDVYKELDADVDAALDTWRQLSAQGTHRDKLHPFRATALSDASQARPTTPEVEPRPASLSHIDTALPPSPPPSTDKKDHGEKPTGQPKSSTTTLGKLMSPDKTSIGSNGSTAKPRQTKK